MTVGAKNKVKGVKSIRLDFDAGLSEVLVFVLILFYTFAQTGVLSEFRGLP